MRAGTFSLIGSLFLTACVGRLDRRPPFSRPDFVRGVQKVVSTANEANGDHGDFVAGWARVEIEAPAGVPLAGYIDRDGARSTGRKDGAFVRAFAFGAGEHRVVLFTADVLLIGPAEVRAIRERLAGSIPSDALFFTASHTHSGPGGYQRSLVWELVFGAYDQASFDAVVAAHVEAARRALDGMSPVQIGVAEAVVSGLVKNRVERDGPTDDYLFVLRFERSNGSGSAALWSYACHAVTLPPSNLLVSGDYPGVVAEAFEGSALELLGYAAGGVGSSNPVHDRDDTGWLTQPLIAALRRALREAESNSRARGSVSSAQVELPAPALRYRVARDVMIAPVVVQALVSIGPINFGAIAVDDTLLVHLPVEISGNLTRFERDRARRRKTKLAIFPFNGTYFGYVA